MVLVDDGDGGWVGLGLVSSGMRDAGSEVAAATSVVTPWNGHGNTTKCMFVFSLCGKWPYIYIVKQKKKVKTPTQLIFYISRTTQWQYQNVATS